MGEARAETVEPRGSSGRQRFPVGVRAGAGISDSLFRALGNQSPTERNDAGIFGVGACQGPESTRIPCIFPASQGIALRDQHPRGSPCATESRAPESSLNPSAASLGRPVDSRGLARAPFAEANRGEAESRANEVPVGRLLCWRLRRFAFSIDLRTWYATGQRQSHRVSGSLSGSPLDAVQHEPEEDRLLSVRAIFRRVRPRRLGPGTRGDALHHPPRS